MENFVIQCIWPARRAIFIDRHRRIVREVEVVQHFEHSVTANRKEWRSHSANIRLLHASIGR